LCRTWHLLVRQGFSLSFKFCAKSGCSWLARNSEILKSQNATSKTERTFLLVEAKLSDSQPSPALRYFAERLSPRWAIQVVRRGDPRLGSVRVLPAERFLTWM
jgi:hypothetical protein